MSMCEAKDLTNHFCYSDATQVAIWSDGRRNKLCDAHVEQIEATVEKGIKQKDLVPLRIRKSLQKGVVRFEQLVETGMSATEAAVAAWVRKYEDE